MVSSNTNTLKSQALKSFKWSACASFSNVLLQVAKLSILARMLAKEDFGLFATISIVIGLADHFVEAGLGSAVIHKQNANKQELASAYTINLILGWFIFIIIYFLAWPIADFYHEIRLIALIHTASIMFLIQPLGRQYDALLRRDLRFKLLSFINISSAFAGTIVAITFAFINYGVYALIFSQLFQVITRNIQLLVIGINNYGLNIGFNKKSAMFFIKFGAFQIGNSIVNYMNSQIDSIIIGKLIGQQELGIFYMTKQLANRPISIINPMITNVLLPIFAKIQNDRDRLKRNYLKITQYIAIIQFAIYFLIATFSREIIIIFLGQDWSNASTILSILCLGQMLIAIGNPIGSLQQAVGRADLEFYWNAFMFSIQQPIIYFSCSYGIIGIACGIDIFRLLGFLLGFKFLIKKLLENLTFKEFYKPILKIMLTNIICFSTIFFIDNSIIIKLIVSIPCCILYIYFYKDVIKGIKS